VAALKKEHLAFLFAGLAFGFLMGFGTFRAIEARPGRAVEAPSAEIPSPMGPAAATQTPAAAQGAGGGAPMMMEINALKERVTSNPKDVQAWSRLANIYQDAGMFDQAVAFYQRAVDLTPNDANLLTDMGICYQGMKQLDKALDLLERAQKADPDHWQSLYNIVVVAGLEMGRADRADAALARLQQIHPDAPNLEQLRQALAKTR
jgi:tetratricopeptide (TPR) repeat protein